MDATMRGDADVSHRLTGRGSSGESSPDELPSTQGGYLISGLPLRKFTLVGRALLLRTDGGQDHLITVGKDRGEYDDLSHCHLCVELLQAISRHWIVLRP